MSRDGSGNYNLPAGQPVSTGTTISSTVHNALASDVASALTQSLSKDGQTTPTANLPMGSFKHTGVADGTARTHYGSLGQLQDGGIWTLGSVSGTDTITASLTPAISSYVAGMEIQMIPAATNTGAVTLAVNGLTAKSILKGNSVALSAGDLVIGVPANLVYIGAAGWLLTNPQNAIANSFQPVSSTVPANGVYLPAANTVGIASNTTLRGSVNSTGNWTFAAPSSGVGITSTAPSGSSFAYRATSQAGAGNYGGMSFFASGAREYGIFALTTDGGLYFQDVTGAATRAILGSSGNWQINAPSSGTALLVNGVSGARGIDIFEAGLPNLSFSTTGGLRSYIQYSEAGSKLTIDSDGILAFDSNNTERMTIASAGNVTVNAPSSGVPLTINGIAATNTAILSGQSTTTGAQYIALSNTGGNYYLGADGSAGGVIMSGSPAYALGLCAAGAQALSLGTNNTERARIASAGNVTINAPSSGVSTTINSVSAGTVLRLTDGTVTSDLSMAGTKFNIGTSGAHSVALYTNSVDRVTISSAGNVTVAAPSSAGSTPLTISSAAATGVTYINGTGSTTGYGIYQITTNAANAYFGVESGAGGAVFAGTSGGDVIVGTPNGAGVSIATNGSVRVRTSSTGNVTINNPSSGVALAVGGVSGTHSATIADAAATTGFKVGYLNIPQNAQTGNYTLVLADAGKHIYHAAGAGAGDTYTIPANASVAYDVGTAITFINRDTTNAVSIAITTDTLTLAGTGATGTRTLAAYGVATAIKITSTEWIISGTGLT